MRSCLHFQFWGTAHGNNLKKFPEILGRSLGRALFVTFLVFFLLAFVFVGNLGPIPAFVFAPVSFLATLLISLFVETMLERNPGLILTLNPALFSWKTYLVLLAVCLTPILIYAGNNHRALTHSGRMENALPLTEDERQLLQSSRLNFRVGVVNPRFPPAYTGSLIRDLKETCLFDEVVEFSEHETVDMLATIKGVYWDSKEGQRFIFQNPKWLNTEVGDEIDVFYKLSPVIFLGIGDHKQYIDRLSVRLIQASQNLPGHSELITEGSLSAAPDERMGCRKDM